VPLLHSVVQARYQFRDGLPPDVHDTPFGAYEAEFAQLNGAIIASNQTGYTGTGFADYVNNTGDFVNWTINTPDAGLYDLSFRYALQSGTRPLSIQLNGQTIEAKVVGGSSRPCERAMSS